MAKTIYFARFPEASEYKLPLAAFVFVCWFFFFFFHILDTYARSSICRMLISKLTNKDHKLVPIPRMCHEIFFEKDGTVPISMALEWILERCGQSVRID